MAYNYFDANGNYINDENLSLADIYHRAFALGVESVAIPTWIPVTYRQMTEEEVKEACEKWGVKEDVLEYSDKIIFNCPLPEDGQEILVSHGGIVTEDICSWNGDFCGLEYYGDWIGIDAWMLPPAPYKKEGADNA